MSLYLSIPVYDGINYLRKTHYEPDIFSWYFEFTLEIQVSQDPISQRNKKQTHHPKEKVHWEYKTGTFPQMCVSAMLLSQLHVHPSNLGFMMLGWDSANTLLLNRQALCYSSRGC